MSYHIVVNPAARGVELEAISQALFRHFEDVDFHLCHDLSPEHLGLAGPGRWPAHDPRLERAPRPADETVVAVGGDGTVSRVIQAIGTSGLRLAIVPAGTANDFAAALGIPADLDQACEAARCSGERLVDLISVNGRYFVTCGGMGLPAAVAARANRWKSAPSPLRSLWRRLGRAIYVLAAGAEMLHRPPMPCLVRCDGATHYGDSLALVFSNQSRFGGCFRVSPAASNRDGVLDLCAIDQPRTWTRRAQVLLAALAGTLERLPGTQALRGRHASVVSDRRTSFFGDGEVLVEDRRFEIEVLPGALRVVVPRDAEES